MKTAVCICGQCRTLNLTYRNIRKNLLDRLKDYDLFMYVPDDGGSRYARLLEPTILKIERDQPIDEGELVNGKNCRFKTGVQSYLQQLQALKMCNALRLGYEKQTGIRYDCVIRSRPDILFMAPVCNMEDLDLHYIYLPDFHHFDGCNDRFAIGNPENMTIYFSKIDHVQTYARRFYSEKGIPLSAEMFTVLHLQDHKIPIQTLPVRFNRVRTHGVIDDLKKTNRKVKNVKD